MKNKGLINLAFFIWGLLNSILIFYCIGAENMNQLTFTIVCAPTLLMFVAIFLVNCW